MKPESRMRGSPLTPHIPGRILHPALQKIPPHRTTVDRTDMPSRRSCFLVVVSSLGEKDDMLKKIHRFALPLLLVLAASAFGSNAKADHHIWDSPASALSDSGPSDPSGDPDVPSQHQGRLRIVGPTDGTMPQSMHGRVWFGHASVWLRVYLSSWFAR